MRFLKANRVGLLLLALGLLLIAIGVWRQETELAFRKAVNICMECIGLG